jgi:two-component system, cell cycle sensor histidine kinase and response regulator CckA
MGPYLFAHAALTGFFLFGAIYHLILWSRARQNWTLLFFAIATLLSGINSYAMVMIATAETTATAQWALDLRGSTATSTVTFIGWLFVHVTGLGSRRVMWAVTFAFTTFFIFGLFTPLAGVVTAVDRVVTPWGETLSVLRRESQTPFLVPAYAVALLVPAIGVIGGWRLRARDRVGGVLTIITSLGYFTSILLSFAIDTRQVSLPYLGAIVSALWILPIAWQVARQNQQQAEQLVATERRYRAIFDQTFQFIGLLDVEGTLREANQTALAFAGLRPQDVIGKPFWETPWWSHSPALQERLRNAIRAAGRGEVVRFEATHPGRDNRLRHIDFSLKPVYDARGAVVLLIPEGHDITERKEAEDALRRSEERFRLLVQNQTEFVVSCQPDATLTFVNDSYCEYFGIRAEDAIGSNLVECFAPKDRETMAVLIAGVTRDKPVAGGEYLVMARADQQRWTHWTAIGIFDADGQLTAIQLTGRDIHDRVMAEEGRQKLEQQLLQSQKMEALGQLAGGIAHDFNNLLTVIAGHTDMLLSDKSNNPARHDLQQIRQASDRAASMTRQLLAFSRQSVLEPKVINLNTVVAQMETMLRRAIGEHIELIVHAAPDAHAVKADPDQLGRALLNMAINARDAMPDGGKLVIETRNVVLPDLTGTVADAGTTPYVLLTMSDTGSGMTAETRSRLFEPFYTTKEQGKGTGLGLAVVDGIVKQSGGRIDVYSEPGAGTTFKVYLPATQAQDTTALPPSDGRVPRGTETVLLVEDEPAVREMTQAALQRHGYTVLPAASGAEALQIARANHGAINVVLTDVVMPGMSGPQLVERLREDQPRLAALFMSGYTSDAVLRHGIETGEADFLQKPFSTSALAIKLRQVLDR